MFKRIALALALVLFAGTVTVNAANPFFGNKKASRSKIDQSSKDAMIKAMVMAVLDKDYDTLWQLLDPQLRKQAAAEGKTKKDFIKLFQEKFDLNDLAKEMGMPQADAVKLLKAFFADDIDTIWALFPQDAKKEAIAEAGSEENAKNMLKQMMPALRKNMAKEFEDNLVQRNGKWYISGDKMLNSGIKQSTKEEAAEAFLTAMAYGKTDVFWQLLCESNKKALIDESGNEENAKKALGEAFKGDEEGQSILKDEDKKKMFIQQLIVGIDQKNAWVVKDGKYYIDFIKLND